MRAAKTEHPAVGNGATRRGYVVKTSLVRSVHLGVGGAPRPVSPRGDGAVPQGSWHPPPGRSGAQGAPQCSWGGGRGRGRPLLRAGAASMSVPVPRGTRAWAWGRVRVKIDLLFGLSSVLKGKKIEATRAVWAPGGAPAAPQSVLPTGCPAPGCSSGSSSSSSSSSGGTARVWPGKAGEARLGGTRGTPQRPRRDSSCSRTDSAQKARDVAVRPSGSGCGDTEGVGGGRALARRPLQGARPLRPAGPAFVRRPWWS